MGESSARSARGHHTRGGFLGRGLWLAALTVLSVLALALPAVAQADDTWTGASTSPNWSDPTNWTTGAPTAPAGILTFPNLSTTLACTTTPPTATCYTSANNVGDVTPTQLVFSNTTPGTGYKILGSGLTVGSGGILDNSGGQTGATINTPLTLGAAQTWAIGMAPGTGYNSLSLAPPQTVTSSFPLTVTFPPSSRGDLFVDRDMEVGQVTVSGQGGLHIGGPSTPGSVNGTNGNPVAINSRATLVANPGAKVGPLSITGGALQLGTGASGTGTTTLGVNGAASIDSASATTTYIDNNGTIPGTDFSQLSASGNVTLAGSLSLNQGPSGSGCVALSLGDVATLFTTKGTLTGTFSNASNGAVIPMNSSCQATPPQVQIAYTGNSVTATVVSGTTPTATTLAASSTSPTAGSSVTYTATVTPNGGPGLPTGNVAFADGGAPISGCTSRPLTAGASSSTATCAVTYPSAGSHSITASYGGNPSFVASTSSPVTVAVQPGPAPPPGPSTLSATTSPATHVGTTRATFNGSVTTGGATVTWQFQYGRSTHYNKGTPSKTIAAGQHKPVSVSAVLKHLAPNVRYHFRLVVSTQSSSAGPVLTVHGKDRTFKTRATGKLLLTAGRLLVSGHTILVPEKCQSGLPCNGRFSITTTAHVGKKHKLGSVLCTTKFFRIKAHRKATVRSTITRSCLGVVRTKPHHRLAAKFTSRPRTGQLGLIKKITLVLR